MENKAHHEPSKLSYQFLKQVTNDFDENRFLGSGGFGVVHKGVYEDGREIAVKVLHRHMTGLDDKEFHKEFDNLSGLKHPNIVELVGFCDEWEGEPGLFQGKQVILESRHLALCFEYVHNGSLHTRISDVNTGFNWHTRYRIIRGICEGLKYLREGLEYPIMHFDLKPLNILLDKCMVPKIADFGSSQLFGEENTRKVTDSPFTSGYCPPEYIKHQIMSREFDIFSLGAIIVRIMMGHDCYNSVVEIPTQKSIKLVHESWRKRLSGTMSHTSLEVCCNQVKRCIEIALNCLISNRQERPTIQDIVSSLNETETTIGDQGRQNEQFYQEDGGSTLPSNVSSVTTNSRPSSGDFPVVEPRVMSLSLLKEMTNDFSKARLLGRGGHGSIYKGVYGDGQVIAVKKLYDFVGLDDRELDDEIAILMKFHHKNIVEFIGYCREIEEEVALFEGKHVIAERIHNLLCFEYFESGSLERYISEDMDSGLDWQTRYGIIKGMCEALRYLQEGLESPIIHTNLKPSNIFMDENMRPKIDCFRLIERTRITMIAREYAPPEYIERQVISKEFDIYSLGIITLQLMTGEQSYREFWQMPRQEFIDLAYEKWSGRLQRTVPITLVEGYCQQVKKCLEIAAMCLEFDRHKRPRIGAIVHALDETEISTLQLENSDLLLEVHPLELQFVYPSLEVPRMKMAAMISSSCSLQLQNKGNNRVAFRLVANIPKMYLPNKPLCGVVSPRCSYTLAVPMRSNKSSSDSGGADFFTLYIAGLDEYVLLNVDKDSVSRKYDEHFKKAKEDVQEVKLKVICVQTVASQGSSSSEPTRSTIEIITTADAQQVSFMDVHPTEPWIMTTNHAGSLRVWDYYTMAALNSFQLEAYELGKFIAREKWLIAGDRCGNIVVYNYENIDIESFEAHDSCITALDVHPTSPFVISSSKDDDHLIKLWDWGNNWKCTRISRTH